jgi:hypothetical protein
VSRGGSLHTAYKKLDVDFEENAHVAAGKTFPECTVVSRRLHLRQSWFDKVQQEETVLSQ